MKPSQALEQTRNAVSDATTYFHTANPRVFGSVLHRYDVDGNNLGLFVDVLLGTTFFDLGGLQEELQELLGVRVQVLTSSDLPLKFRKQVILEARPV